MQASPYCVNSSPLGNANLCNNANPELRAIFNCDVSENRSTQMHVTLLHLKTIVLLDLWSSTFFVQLPPKGTLLKSPPAYNFCVSFSSDNTDFRRSYN